MKRNFIQRYAPYLFAAVVLLTGCAKEDPAGGSDGSTRVSFTLGGSAAPAQTRAMGDNGDAGTLAALPEEKSIDNVLALLYRADFPSKGLYQVMEPTLGESGSYEFPVGDAGLYKVYFVANADETLAAAVKALPKGSQLKAFDDLVASQAPDVSGRFLMVSVDGVLIEVRLGSTSAIAEAVRMQRLSTRFDIVNKAEGFTITSITFNNRVVRSKLAAGSGSMPGEWFERKVYTPESPFVGSLEHPTSYEAHIYAYENYAVAKGSAQLSSLEIAYTDRDGKQAVHTVEFFDAKSDPFDPTPLALKRNCLYRIVLTEQASLECELQVADWDEAERFDIKALPVNFYPCVKDGHTIVVKDDQGQADPTLYIVHEPWQITPAHSEATWDGKASGKNTYGATFRVASKDAATAASWDDAKSACNSYTEITGDIATWRLPTVRELKLIYDNKDVLTEANMPSEGNYWSATGVSGNTGDAYAVGFDGRGAISGAKSSSYRVRCVRDEGADKVRDSYPYFDNNVIVVRDDKGMADPITWPTHGKWDWISSHCELNPEENRSGYNTVAERFTFTGIGEEGKGGNLDWTCKNHQNGVLWRAPTYREALLLCQLYICELPEEYIPERVYSGTGHLKDDTDFITSYWAVRIFKGVNGCTLEHRKYTELSGEMRSAFCVRDL